VGGGNDSVVARMTEGVGFWIPVFTGMTVGGENDGVCGFLDSRFHGNDSGWRE